MVITKKNNAPYDSHLELMIFLPLCQKLWVVSRVLGPVTLYRITSERRDFHTRLLFTLRVGVV